MIAAWASEGEIFGNFSGYKNSSTLRVLLFKVRGSHENCQGNAEIVSRGGERVGVEEIVQPRDWCYHAQGKNTWQIL